ncbi:MAG: endonuclease domain-containing protein [Syntrophobacterales bacterium]|nr:endonuclease domain-containing protein [Syntrophobacterales bacterium]
MPDFDCLEKRYCCVDGGQPLAGEHDKIRDKRLHATGFFLFGLWDNGVLQNIDAVIGAILTPSPPRPSP